MRKLIIVFIVFITFTACNNNVVFDVYKPIDSAKWNKDSILTFTYNPTDTISKNNIYINIRNNKEYQYSNLFLIVGINFPNNYQVVDTLEYEMADAQGKFLGTGFTDIKENKLEYKTNVTFPTEGNYEITVQQAMRKSGDVDGIKLLKGVTDVGLQIEKIATND